MTKTRQANLIEAGVSPYDLARVKAVADDRLLEDSGGHPAADLCWSFGWADSPQGPDFWVKWHEAVSYNRPGPRTLGAILHDAGIPLDDLLRVAAEVPRHSLDERAKGEHPGHVLGYAFRWDKAPQPESYWVRWYMHLNDKEPEPSEGTASEEQGYLEEEEKPEPRVRLTFTIPESTPISHLLSALGHLRADDLDITGRGDT